MGKVTDFPLPEVGEHLRPPEAIGGDHDLSSFDCGQKDLNGWLQSRAMASEGRSARTMVLPIGNRVIGYYCLATGAVDRANLPNAKTKQNMPETVPVLVLGRLAVDINYQNRGFGGGLLKDAMKRALSASQIAGARALIVHAVDEKTCQFYRSYGFLKSPTNPLTLILPIETIVAALN